MEMTSALHTGDFTLVDRYAALIREFLPNVELLSSALPRDEQVMEAARRAESRLAGERVMLEQPS